MKLDGPTWSCLCARAEEAIQLLVWLVMGIGTSASRPHPPSPLGLLHLSAFGRSGISITPAQPTAHTHTHTQTQTCRQITLTHARRFRNCSTGPTGIDGQGEPTWTSQSWCNVRFIGETSPVLPTPSASPLTTCSCIWHEPRRDASFVVAIGILCPCSRALVLHELITRSL
ncbi:hypothetical protein F5Y18DRAFT_284986 [Xylariaceae sp. FL1019]|nr:hypothetical protein F5Y18DRAFT_284986 [Xylariaceae sp. FL1019]